MTSRPAPSARAQVLLVARRELVERLRGRGFLVSTAVTALLVLGAVLLGSLVNAGAPTYRLAVDASTGEGPTVARRLAATTPPDVARFQVVEVDGSRAAGDLVARGEVDAALVDDDPAELETLALVGGEALPERLVLLVRAADLGSTTARRLTLAGADPQLLDVPPVPVRLQDGGDPLAAERRGVALAASLLLYGQLSTYGLWVALGVVEERTGRIAEVLLPRVHPRRLLAGKVLGVGLLGLAQVALLLTLGLAAAVATGAVADPAALVGTELSVLAWFVLGFSLYATAFAAAAASVRRPADLQQVTTPLAALLAVSFLVAVAVATGDGPLRTAASLLPPTSAVVMPVRVAASDVPVGQQLLAAGLLLAVAAVLVRVAAARYVRGVLGRT